MNLDEFPWNLTTPLPTSIPASSVSNRRLVLGDTDGRGVYVYVPEGFCAVLLSKDEPYPPHLLFQSASKTTTLKNADKPLSAAITATAAATTTIRPKSTPPRPANAFILYRRDHHVHLRALYPTIKNEHLSKVIADCWWNESSEVREKYMTLSALEKEKHKKKFPGYKYQPRPSKKKKGYSCRTTTALAIITTTATIIITAAHNKRDGE